MNGNPHTASFNALLRYAPLWAHLSVYVLTCLIAATLFYFDYRMILVFTEYFSGVSIPNDYTFQQAAVLWSLLLGMPILFALGFFAVMRTYKPATFPLLRKFVGPVDQDVSAWMPMLLFVTSASLGAYDLLRAGTAANLTAWVDYGAWVQARWEIFSTLSFFNFVNIYSILPVSAAWLILSIQGDGWKALAKRLAPLMIVVIVSLLLFQKKTLIASLILIFGAVLLHKALIGAWTRRLTWLFSVILTVLTVSYFVMVVLPVYAETSRTLADVLIQQTDQAEKPKTSERLNQLLNEISSYIGQAEKPKTSERLNQLLNEISSYIGSDRDAYILVYTLLAPMTRSSLPAMYYPIVFPEQHGYYGLDFGQDILGFGGMPDDNVVIWNHMYPNLPGGSAYSSYQFTLYSQVGVVWTLLLCLLVGAALAVMWQIILAADINRIWRSLMGAVLILFSIHITIDSIRGSLLVSYGVIWPWLFISLSFFIARLFNCRQMPWSTERIETASETDTPKP